MIPTKYKSVKVVFDGIKWDSKEECRYYQYLKKLQEQGTMLSFKLQPQLTLIPGFRLPCGQLQRPITYTPDFLVGYGPAQDRHMEYIDIKGMSTQQSELRRKLYNWISSQMPEVDQVPLKWIASSFKYGDKDGWIDWDELQKKRRMAKKKQKEKVK